MAIGGLNRQGTIKRNLSPLGRSGGNTGVARSGGLKGVLTKAPSSASPPKPKPPAKPGGIAPNIGGAIRPGAPAPAPTGPSLADLLKDFMVDVPTDGPPIDPYDAQHLLTTTNAKGVMNVQLAPLERRLAELNAGNMGLFRTRADALNRASSRSANSLVGGLASRGMLQSGLHDQGAGQIAEQFQQERTALDSELGERAVADLRFQMEQIRRAAGAQLLGELQKAVVVKQAGEIDTATGDEAPKGGLIPYSGKRDGYFRKGGAWYRGSAKDGHAFRVNMTPELRKRVRIVAAPK